MVILETERLTLRKIILTDAPFIFKLVNDPSWLKYIGDRGVKTLHDARRYIKNGPLAMYRQYGFGLYLVVLKTTKIPIGICGIIKRESLIDPDIGFAFLPQYTGLGYATESGKAVMEYGKNTLGLRRILAITSPDNHASINVVEKLGLKYKKLINLSNDNSQCKLFAP